MNYQETLHYLYTRTPLFQQKGAGAYKEGLQTTLALDAHAGHPHRQFRSIHVAGTNGKGSCSHTLASILQEAGYRVGLYTSPHLLDFRERIRVNGEMMPEEAVVEWVEANRVFFEPLSPSFFEVTTVMAFEHFAKQQVDVAVVEVGLGGRLDCTNIITPELSLITNISFDHVQFLGNTLAKIAVEKAGIIKHQVPVVVGETTDETRPVFRDKAAAMQAPLTEADATPLVQRFDIKPDGFAEYVTSVPELPTLRSPLAGFCQEKNTNTLLHVLPLLCRAFPKVDDEAVRRGFERVVENTHLMGRWQRVSSHPCPTVCDTGHNSGGFQYIARQLAELDCRTLRIVFGMVNDKDTDEVLSLLPREAVYYFAQASVERARPAEEMRRLAAGHGLQGRCFPTVASAYEAAQAEAEASDFIYVGGSTFVVADLLQSIKGNG